MRIINHSGHFDYELTINGNKVGPNQEIIVGEMMFNSQDIFSDIGSVEIITEYGKRTFRCYGSLKAYESKDLKDANGSAAILIINTIPQLHYKGENKKIESIDAYMNEDIVGDLISRSALIKGMQTKLGLHDEENGAEPWYMEALGDVEDLIKKMPSAAVNCKECDGYEAGYSAGLKDAERPTGKWIFKKFLETRTGIINSDWCPFCGMVKVQVYDNFCGNCGADMR